MTSDVSTGVPVLISADTPPADPVPIDVNSLIADGSYAKIFAKWGVADTAVTSSVLNPTAGF